MSSKPKRVAFYVRVSTNDQTVENQLQELYRTAENHGWEVVAEIRDEGISGAKGRKDRPGFNELYKGVQKRAFDIVASWSADRLSRSTLDLCELVELLNSKGIDLYLEKESIDTQTPMGKAMFQISAVFAELERGRIRERVVAGLERAKAQGKKLGRPRVSPEIEQAIRDAKAEKKGILRIAKEVGVGTATVQRVLNQKSA